MVAARRTLLREIRRLAIRDELRVMRTRGRLVVPPWTLPPRQAGGTVPPPPPGRIERH